MLKPPVNVLLASPAKLEALACQRRMQGLGMCRTRSCASARTDTRMGALVFVDGAWHAAQVWRMPDLVQVLTLRGHRRGVWAVQFSPVDQALLTGSGDATLRLWSLADGSCLRTFEGHSASVLRVAFLSAGTQACTHRHVRAAPVELHALAWQTCAVVHGDTGR